VVVTFIFTSSVLSIIYAKIDNKLAGILIIVFTLAMCIGSAGPISGGCVNPAVGIAQSVF
jgi:glycerol uptake facilitator-like aquaporin